ncbi:MAG: polysaccharide deacetylase [Solirubrobacterales bacterium]|nr:polysaccharide deacetylase [Solirubrobacterales bacterium]
MAFAGGSAREAAAQDGPAATAVTGCQYTASGQVRRGPSAHKRVALTFDDGPAALTTSVLTVLEREHVPATFFIVGRNVAGREATLRRALADGSMLGNHSFTHVSLAAADDAALQEITDTQAAIRDATGFTPCLLRPPFGLSSRKLVQAAGTESLKSILWSVNSKDFTEPGTKVIKKRVLDGVRAGSIVLMHDGGGQRRQTLAALPDIIRTLKARGYRFVTVTDLLGLKLVRG